MISNPSDKNADNEIPQIESSLRDVSDEVVSSRSQKVAKDATLVIEDKWLKLDRMVQDWASRLTKEIIECIRVIQDLPLSKDMSFESMDEADPQKLKLFFNDNIFE